jgi:hypothetical protein
MTSFDTLQSVSSRLRELSNQLSSSKLSKEELEEFETLSRKLYERAIILNYKAKEESVYGKTPQKNSSTETSEPKVETIVEKTVDVKEEPKEAEVNSDEGEGGVEFDFSGGFDTSMNEPVSKPESSKPVVEIPVEAEKQQKTPAEEPIEEKPTVEQATNNKSDEILDDAEENSSSFYERFSKAQRLSAGDRLGTSKVNSLKDAIGLNDRLQFVSELFGGNSESYNSTIDVLDQLENNEIALRKLSEIAAKENWNKELSAVNEFAHFINRRYAD